MSRSISSFDWIQLANTHAKAERFLEDPIKSREVTANKIRGAMETKSLSVCKLFSRKKNQENTKKTSSFSDKTIQNRQQKRLPYRKKKTDNRRNFIHITSCNREYITSAIYETQKKRKRKREREMTGNRRNGKYPHEHYKALKFLITVARCCDALKNS